MDTNMMDAALTQISSLLNEGNPNMRMVWWMVVLCPFWMVFSSFFKKVQVLAGTHAAITTVTSVYTIVYEIDPMFTIMVSVSYFFVHFFQIHQEPHSPSDRKMTYGHHVIGMLWGVLLLGFDFKPILYVYLQTNEVSNPFLSYWRLTNSFIAGILFAVTFFLSRVVMNTVFTLPLFVREAPWYLVALSAPYFGLQYVWFYKIYRRICKHFTAKKS